MAADAALVANVQPKAKIFISYSRKDMARALRLELAQSMPIAWQQVTIPPLQDGEEWTKFEAARRTLWQHLGNSKPAPRYGIHSSAAARAQASAA